MMLYYFFCSKQYSKPKCTCKAKSKHRLLVPVTPLHSVCGLYTIHVIGQMLSASLLQLHCFTWCCTAATESIQPNFLHLNCFFLMVLPMLLHLGANYSTEIQRATTSNYRSLSLQVYAVPLRGGLAGPPFTLRRKTLHLSAMGSAARFLLEPINTNLYAS